MTVDIGDIVRALDAYGLCPQQIEPLPTPVGAQRQRASFRVETEDGRRLKARRMDNAQAAARQHALRQELPAAFAPVLFRHDAVLLEKWIDGRSLHDGVVEEDHIRQLAVLMRSLHMTGSAAGQALPFQADIGELRSITASCLDFLEAGRVLEPAIIARLRTIAAISAPALATHRLIHTDLCGENLVVDAAGRVSAIDNEHFRFGPAGMDLARLWYRSGWYGEGADGPSWRLFCHHYGADADVQDDARHRPFWRLAATVLSARLRVGTAAATDPLRCLRIIAQDDIITGFLP